MAFKPFTVKHATWLYNQIPSRITGLTPIELLTKTCADHQDLLRTHVWVCPTFALNPKLQNGQKIPKWNQGAWMGQFLCFLDDHLSLVANVRNLRTRYISPQFRVVFNELFHTVFSLDDNDIVVDAFCNQLFENNQDIYAEDELNVDRELIYSPPPLDEVWLSEPEH